MGTAEEDMFDFFIGEVVFKDSCLIVLVGDVSSRSIVTMNSCRCRRKGDIPLNFRSIVPFRGPKSTKSTKESFRLKWLKNRLKSLEPKLLPTASYVLHNLNRSPYIFTITCTLEGFSRMGCTKEVTLEISSAAIFSPPVAGSPIIQWFSN